MYNETGLGHKNKKNCRTNFYFAPLESYKLIELWELALLFTPYVSALQQFYWILLIALSWDII